jgi:hypothetical protein
MKGGGWVKAREGEEKEGKEDMKSTALPAQRDLQTKYIGNSDLI